MREWTSIILDLSYRERERERERDECSVSRSGSFTFGDSGPESTIHETEWAPDSI
jgi:hypothetical protein